MREAFEETRQIATGVAGELRLGMYTPVNGGPHLTEIIKTFEARYPACHVVVTDTSARRDQFAWLRRNYVDLLAIRLPVPHPDVTVGPVLSREPRIVAVAADHPLGGEGIRRPRRARGLHALGGGDATTRLQGELPSGTHSGRPAATP
jgi:DNA-binding transcriptional LysR family regulator